MFKDTPEGQTHSYEDDCNPPHTPSPQAPEEKSKGKCCICNKDTELYCGSCARTWGEFAPTWFCDEHYKTTVMTGNCCSGNERNYE